MSAPACRRSGPFVVMTLAVIWGFSAPSQAAAQWLELSVPARPAAGEVAVEAGRALYLEYCWFCHGEEGDGKGPVAESLWPRPRDFTVASFMLRTTASGELPTDEDLFRTITRGVPGTAMPEWGSFLTIEQRWQVIAYVKSFASDLFENELFDPYQALVEIGDPPSGSREILATAGKEVFQEADCWQCHGQAGRGNGEKASDLRDDWDVPILPTDLQVGWTFKGGRSAPEIYLRLSSGLDGTPMPSYSETLSDDERWQLANYVASLSEETDAEGPGGVVITARRIEGEVPQSPADPEWENAAEVDVPLSGQSTFAPRWQIPAVRDLSVRALYNDDELALRLAWDDRFADTLAADSALATEEGYGVVPGYPVLYPDGQRVRGRFPDGAEVMFPVRTEESPVLPHFVYGSSGRPVDLWSWRADLTSPGDGFGAVQESRAAGAQRPPEAHAPESQLVTGQASWVDGRWTLVMRRPLTTEEGAREVQFAPGATIPIAFHVREGANGETGLRMAVSSWYFLNLSEPASPMRYALVLLVVLVAFAAEYGVVRWMRVRAQRGLLRVYGVEPLAS